MTNLQTIKIRYNSPDYVAAVDIRKQVFVVEQSVPEELEVDQYESTCDHFLTTLDNVPVAAGRMRVKDKYIKFERIACLKSKRGHGIGKHLMETMLNYALAFYPGFIPYMHSQADVVPFYEKLGWMSYGDIFYEANIPHLAMIYKGPK